MPVAPAPGRLQPAPTFADPRLKADLHTAKRVVARGTPLLLQGETGTGKEVFARALHRRRATAGRAVRRRQLRRACPRT